MPNPHPARRFRTITNRTLASNSDIGRKTAQAYAAHARTYLRVWGQVRRRPRLLLDCLSLFPHGAAILDLGSGAGQDGRFIQKLGYRVTGLDLTWPFLQAAHRRSRLLPLIHADVRRLPFRPGSFDGVWAAASLIHLPKSAVRKTLVDLQSVVKPKGTLAATFVHGRRSGFLRSGWIPGRFFSRWYRAELARAVEQAGWQVLHLRTVANRERRGRWLNLLARRRD
ncbi:MAG: class I SAM-dependent methyltransferase [Nitrospiraceae bacterium]